MMNWPQEIYLTVDEKWPITLSNNPSDPIEIKEVYTLRRLDGIPGENRILC